jgi:hypothetical protein
MDMLRPKNYGRALLFDASVSIIPPTITALTVIVQYSKLLTRVENHISMRLRNTKSFGLIGYKNGAAVCRHYAKPGTH